MKTLEEQCLEKLNLETRCLEKLNKILSKFDLKIVIIKVNQLNQRQHRLVYKNDTANWLELWLSISDMLFTRTISRYITNSIFECLKTYYLVISNPSFNRLNMRKDTLSRFQDCSDAYKEIMPLKSSSLEEFLINCDLMGV
jgi:hypothetical protein